MTATGVEPDAVDCFLVITLDQAYAALGVRLDQLHNIFAVNSSVRAAGLPRFSGIVCVLVLLDPDASLREQVHAAGVVPMHMSDDHIGDVLRLEAQPGDCLGWFDEVSHLPLLKQLVAIE